MPKQPFKDPSQPASPGHLGGRGGAVPSTPGDGAFGERGAARDGAVPRASICDRCEGVFSELVDERAYQRGDNAVCKTCGAAAHFERSAIRRRKWDGPDYPELVLYESETLPFQFEPDWWGGLGQPGRERPRDYGGRDDWRKSPRLAANAYGFLDGDGTWCVARTMLGEDKRNYGRHKTYWFSDDGTPSGGRAANAPKGLPEDWIPENAASTGQRVGRPVKGARDPDAVLAELWKGLQDERVRAVMPEAVARWKAKSKVDDTERYVVMPQKALRVPLEIALSVVGSRLNKDATAKEFGFKSKQTVYDWIRRGTERIEKSGLNSHKGGGTRTEIRDGRPFKVFVIPEGQRKFVPPPTMKDDDMNVVTVHERLDRLERQLAEIHRDTAETVERLRERFPNNEEVAEAVEQFLGEALSDAA